MTETTPESELRAGPDAGEPSAITSNVGNPPANVASQRTADIGAAEATDAQIAAESASAKPVTEAERPVEYGGPSGPEPTRYGDWERKGRCVDF